MQAEGETGEDERERERKKGGGSGRGRQRTECHMRGREGTDTFSHYCACHNRQLVIIKITFQVAHKWVATGRTPTLHCQFIHYMYMYICTCIHTYVYVCAWPTVIQPLCTSCRMYTYLKVPNRQPCTSYYVFTDYLVAASHGHLHL